MKLSIPLGFKLNKTWIILSVALAIGALAALVAYSYLSDRMSTIEARARGETVPVVVAKRDLPKGARLSEENVAVRSIPRDFAHSVAVIPSQFDRLDGQTLAFPIKGGEMILWSLTEGKKTPTFSARVEVGRRAITVPVDEINSISGMLEPGDVIDLIVTVQQKSKKVTFPLLQHVQVMATGQRAVDDAKSGERRSFSTVTLDTTPEQAQNVIVAREVGKITALLRNPQDKRPLSTTRGDISRLLGLQDDLAGQSPERQVPVLYGGKSKFEPEDLKLLERVKSVKLISTAEDKSTLPSLPGEIEKIEKVRMPSLPS